MKKVYVFLIYIYPYLTSSYFMKGDEMLYILKIKLYLARKLYSWSFTQEIKASNRIFHITGTYPKR